MNKTIAIVVNDSWHAYNMRFNLGLEFQKNGYNVVFVAPYNNYSEKLKEKFSFIPVGLSAKGKNPIEDIKTIYNFYKIYKELKPDIILHYTIKPNIYGTIAASILNIPTINNIAGLGTLFISQNIVTKIAKCLYSFSQKRASKIFFQNNDDYTMFENEKLVDKSKCEVLPGSGVDIEKFKPINKTKDNTFKFILASRILWAKGIGEYVEAAKIIKEKYKNVEFYLLGFLDVESPTAISRAQVNSWVEEGSITYLGSSDAVNEEIAKVDCVVLPSYYREGVPRILLESASMEKAIITTNSVGCRDVVDDGINGYLCEAQNAQDLVKKMEMMINLSPEVLSSMGKAGRSKIVKYFDEKIVIQKYLDSIKEILQ